MANKNTNRLFLFIFLLAGSCVSYSEDKLTNSLVFVAVEWPPFFFKNPKIQNKDKLDGLYIDLMGEIFGKRLNLPFQVKQLPWKRAQQQIKYGNADLMITVPTAERLQFSEVSDRPLLKLYMHVYTYKNNPRLNEIKKIKTPSDIQKLGLVPVTYLGNGWHKNNIDPYGVKTQYIRQDEGTIKYLTDKRADILIETNFFINYRAKQIGLESEIEDTGIKFGPIDYHLFMSKKSKHLKRMPLVNITINELHEQGKIEQVSKKYLFEK